MQWLHFHHLMVFHPTTFPSLLFCMCTTKNRGLCYALTRSPAMNLKSLTLHICCLLTTNRSSSVLCWPLQSDVVFLLPEECSCHGQPISQSILPALHPLDFLSHLNQLFFSRLCCTHISALCGPGFGSKPGPLWAGPGNNLNTSVLGRAWA